MKKFIIVFSLGVLVSTFTQADDTQDQARQSQAVERAKADYRVYLEGLKKISRDYTAVTGEVKKVIKEEGIPVWDDASGGLKITHDLNAPDNVPFKETEKDIKVIIDIPGVKKNTIKVTVEGERALSIHGVRKVDNADQVIDKTYTLPDTSDYKNPKAKYEDGVLTITIDKVAIPKKQVTVPVE